MSHKFILVLTILLLGLMTGSSLAQSITPNADIRVRQELLDGVYHFAPNPDRDWIRVRTRVGVNVASGTSQIIVRLNNEHRHYLDPDQKLDWDEVIIDQALWRWQPTKTTTLNVGRQNIIWPGGFLMLEGHPLDGSRSMYHNAVRLTTRKWCGKLDVALIRNYKYDDLVLIGDEHRALSAADEWGFAARHATKTRALSFIYKAAKDPDGVLPFLTTWTTSWWQRHEFSKESSLASELAVQYQDSDDHDGWALAGRAKFQNQITANATGSAGFFFYSGQGDNLEAFRTPWGSWPKWSELYIYSLIGESTPGRVHVAAWENIAAPSLSLNLNRPSVMLSASYLMAPEPDWEVRGLLLRTKYSFTVAKNLTGHLLWEMFDPGSFHDGSNGLPPLTDTIHFLRWQLDYVF